MEERIQTLKEKLMLLLEVAKQKKNVLENREVGSRLLSHY